LIALGHRTRSNADNKPELKDMIRNRSILGLSARIQLNDVLRFCPLVQLSETYLTAQANNDVLVCAESSFFLLSSK
jgi:hypothetical protein